MERNHCSRCWRHQYLCPGSLCVTKVSGELLIKKKNIYVDSWTLFTTAMAHAIIQLHVMTDCDHNCGFYGHRKKAVIKKLWKPPKQEFCYMNVLMQFQFQLMYCTFVIKYVYGSKEFGCVETWATQWEKMKKKNTHRLMPDEDTLNHICLHAN